MASIVKSRVIIILRNEKRNRQLVCLLCVGLVMTLGTTLYSIGSLERHEQHIRINEAAYLNGRQRMASEHDLLSVVAMTPLPRNGTPNKSLPQLKSLTCARRTLCHLVGSFVQLRRSDILKEVEKSEWVWHLPHVATYYEKCVVNDTKSTTILEVGELSSGYGASAKYMMDHFKIANHLNITYHVMDSFTVKKALHRVFRRTTPTANADDISHAWQQSMTDPSLGIQTDIDALKLFIHRASFDILGTIQETYNDSSLNAIFIDNLQTALESTDKPKDAIVTTLLTKLKPHGSLIVTWHSHFWQEKGEWMAAILRALTENGESFDIRWIDLDQQTGMDTSTTEYDCSQNEIVLKHITQMAPSIDPSAEQQANSVDDHSFFAPNDVVAVTGLSTSKSCAQHASSVVSFCATKQPPCMKHALDNDESPPREVPLPSSSTPHCKILWIAGFHEGPNACSGRDKYARDYSAALQSMLANAADVLQPVLVVGRYGLENENSTDLSVIGQWAQSMGAKVILWPRLSFQEHVILSSHGIGRENHQYLMGPFMRLDIPKILEQHGLLDQEGICPQHVLYTDSDVLFTSKLSHKDIMALKIDLLSKPQAIVSYGREYLMNDPLPHNTGVMMMDVPAFAKEWPSILAFTLRQPQFPLHDQELLNAYFTQSLDHENKRAMLRTFWNWKSYWRLYPHHFNEVKIVHFHGPKPDKMLEEIGNCSFMDDNSLQAVTSLYSDYEPLLLQGVCCDQGRTTHWALELFRMYVDMTAKSMEGASMKKCWT